MQEGTQEMIEAAVAVWQADPDSKFQKCRAIFEGSTIIIEKDQR